MPSCPKDMKYTCLLRHRGSYLPFRTDPKSRNKKRACHGDMGLAKRTCLKKIFMTACVRRLLGGPPPKNIFIADLPESHKLPILDQKRQISQKGDKFAHLIITMYNVFTMTHNHLYETFYQLIMNGYNLRRNNAL